jgi:formylglycine-generating enzyme required for sulfatase activity
MKKEVFMKKTIFTVLILLFGSHCGKPEEPVLPVTEDTQIQQVPKGMVLIPAGYYTMGSDSGTASPKHRVWIDAFFIDQHEVTNQEYNEFTQATGHPNPPFYRDHDLNKPDQPVVGISYYDALSYAQWTGKRLPTEAEWERAARGGLESRQFPWGDEPVGKKCNFAPKGMKEADGYEYTAPVGRFPANDFGLYDMAGNVWEWCLDFYSLDYYKSSPERNPQGPDSGYTRVLRGGSWLSINPKYLKCSSRMELKPFVQDRYYGFRCAKTP